MPQITRGLHLFVGVMVVVKQAQGFSDAMLDVLLRRLEREHAADIVAP